MEKLKKTPNSRGVSKSFDTSSWGGLYDSVADRLRTPSQPAQPPGFDALTGMNNSLDTIKQGIAQSRADRMSRHKSSGMTDYGLDKSFDQLPLQTVPSGQKMVSEPNMVSTPNMSSNPLDRYRTDEPFRNLPEFGGTPTRTRSPELVARPVPHASPTRPLGGSAFGNLMGGRFDQISQIQGETRAINNLRDRIANLPQGSSTPDAQALSDARRREFARQNGGLSENAANGRRQGQLDAAEFANRPSNFEHTQSKLSPLAGEAKFHQSRQAPVDPDPGYHDRVAKGYDRINKDSDGDGVTDRDEAVRDKFGKYGINSFNELDKATGEYNNYMRQWRAAGKPGRYMKSDEFFKWRQSNKDKQAPWTPDAGQTPWAPGAGQDPQRQPLQLGGQPQVQPQTVNGLDFRQAMARNQAIASAAAAQARARGASVPLAQAIGNDTLRQQGKLQAVNDLSQQQQLADARNKQFEFLQQRAMEADRMAREDQIRQAEWKREDQVAMRQQAAADKQAQREAFASLIPMDPGIVASQTLNDGLAAGRSFDEVREASERAYRQALPVYNATAQAMGIDRPAGSMPSFDNLVRPSLPEEGLYQVASEDQVKEVAKQLQLEARKIGAKLTEKDVERELNKQGLSYMHPDFKTNASKNSDFFDTLVGMASTGLAFGPAGPGIAAAQEYLMPEQVRDQGSAIRKAKLPNPVENSGFGMSGGLNALLRRYNSSR